MKETPFTYCKTGTMIKSISKSNHILSVIIDPKESAKTCCICFKTSIEIVKLHELFEILGPKGLQRVSVSEIITYLLPAHEMLLNQVCHICTDLLLKFYTILKKRENYIKSFKHIVDSLNREVKIPTNSNMKKLKLYLSPEKSKDRKNLDYHQKIKEHKVKKNAFKVLNKSTYCRTCEIEFTEEMYLSKHINKCKPKLLTCHDCGKTFSTKKKLISHIKTHIVQTCPYCEKLIKKSSFKSHFKLHITGKRTSTNYKCKECNYETTCKSSLEAHCNKTHLKIRPHICKICSKGFFKKGNLVEHSQIHYKEKKLICEVCGQSFTNIKCLTQHKSVHLEEKGYKCDFCESLFKSLHRKKEHMKGRHSEKKFACKQCDKAYGLQKELNRHVKTVHSE